jgi:hypothetical protein
MFFGIEVPGIKFQDQKYNIDINWKIMNETESSISKQTENEQCIKYIYAETVLSMTLRGNPWGNLHANQGRLPGSSPLRSDGSCSRQSGSQEDSNESRKMSQGNYRTY